MVEDPIFKSGLGRHATLTHRLNNQHLIGLSAHADSEPCVRLQTHFVPWLGRSYSHG